jgi:hypothetical protein
MSRTTKITRYKQLTDKYKNYQFIVWGENVLKFCPDGEAIPFTFLPQGWRGQDWDILKYSVDKKPVTTVSFAFPDIDKGVKHVYDGTVYVWLKEPKNYV